MCEALEDPDFTLELADVPNVRLEDVVVLLPVVAEFAQLFVFTP
jgi:hypothetical protein